MISRSGRYLLLLPPNFIRRIAPIAKLGTIKPPIDLSLEGLLILVCFSKAWLYPQLVQSKSKRVFRGNSRHEIRRHLRKASQIRCEQEYRPLFSVANGSKRGSQKSIRHLLDHFNRSRTHSSFKSSNNNFNRHVIFPLY